MKNWQNILQSKLFLFIITIITCILVLTSFLKPRNIEFPKTNEIEGILENYQFDGDQLSLTLKSEPKIIGFYHISSEEEKRNLQNEIKYGLKMKWEGEFSLPQTNQIPNTFSYREYLYYKHIPYQMKIQSFQIIQKPNILYQIKNIIASRIQKMPSKSYFQAFFLGDSSELDQESLRKNGISHLFAVSGMHLAFFLALWQKCFKKTKRNQILLFFVLLFYLFLVNFTPSFLRVILFYMLREVSNNASLKWSKLKCFWFTFCFSLWFDPFFLVQQGFQYSFLLSFGLLFLKKENSYWKNLLKTTCFLFFLSLPLTTSYQYEINFLSMLWNLLLIPFVSILYPLCFFLLLFPIFSNPFIFLFQCFNALNSFFSKISWGIISVPKVPIPFWLTYYAWYFLFLKTKQKKHFFLLVFLLLFIKIKPFLSPYAFVTYLNVGEGDAILLVSPHQKESYLIDTGGASFQTKESWAKKDQQNYLAQNIVTYLHSLGIDTLTLILTHGDQDHMGNALDLLEQLKIKQVILNQGSQNELETQFIQQLQKKQIPYSFGASSLKFGNTFLEFLNTKVYENENDNSNVIYLAYQQTTFLFMGDAEKAKEEDIIKKYQIPLITFLKVGHHGSKTSSNLNFIKKLEPKYSIISVGQNNLYHHPHEEVLDRLKNSWILRTDQMGTIEVKLKRKTYEIKLFPC